MIINKIEIEFYQESDNEVGSEDLLITINPSLIGLFKEGKPDYFYTFKTAHGFSFNDKNEIIEIIDKIESIIQKAI